MPIRMKVLLLIQKVCQSALHAAEDACRDKRFASERLARKAVSDLRYTEWLLADEEISPDEALAICGDAMDVIEAILT